VRVFSPSRERVFECRRLHPGDRGPEIQFITGVFPGSRRACGPLWTVVPVGPALSPGGSIDSNEACGVPSFLQVFTIPWVGRPVNLVVSPSPPMKPIQVSLFMELLFFFSCSSSVNHRTRHPCPNLCCDFSNFLKLSRLRILAPHPTQSEKGTWKDEPFFDLDTTNLIRTGL